MTLMTPPPLDQEEEEILMPHSDLAPNGPQPVEVVPAEADNAVDTQSVDDPPSARFTWTIENFTRLNTKKLYSEIFLVGGYKWRVLIFPKGDKVKHLSMYLDVADSATLPYGWSRYAQVSIAVINQLTNKFTVRKDTQHQFNAQQSDWGFTSFMPLGELNDPSRGYRVNDTVVVEVDVATRKQEEEKMLVPHLDLAPNGPQPVEDAEHKFNAKERDWGFTSLLPLGELNDPEEGFLVNDTIVLGAVEPEKRRRNEETGDYSSGNVEADITGTSAPQSMLQSIMGSQINFVDSSSEATATAGKVRFLSCWVSSEAFLLLEKIHHVHNGTFVKFSIKVQALQTVLLESFASFIASMSSIKVNDVSEEALRLAAISIEDFELVGLDLRWLKERLEEAKTVKKYSESVNTVDSCGSALEVARGALEVARGAFKVARAKVRELEEGLAIAKAEVEVMSSRELPKSVGLNDFVLKDIV